ncbi:MAG: guanylate kinase [Patescibacteria group bacterium]
MNYPGTFVIIVGAAGSGKGVLIRRAKELHPEIVFAVSATTRTIRPGETDGHPYHFLSKEAFEARIESGDFLEWAAIDGGKLYGTPKEEVIPVLMSGGIVLKEMEVQGVHQVQQILPKENLVTVYIDAGPWESLSKRIQGRAPISAEELESRRLRFEYEKSFKDEATYVVENLDGRFDEADAAFADIISGVITGAKQ